MAVHQNSADRGHAPQATGSPPGPGGISWGGGTRLGNVTDSARARAGGPPEKPAEASPWASGAVTCPGSPSHPKGQAPSLPRTPEGAEGALENSCLRERGLGVRAALRGTRGLELHTASTGEVHALGGEGSAPSPSTRPRGPRPTSWDGGGGAPLWTEWPATKSTNANAGVPQMRREPQLIALSQSRGDRSRPSPTHTHSCHSTL